MNRIAASSGISGFWYKWRTCSFHATVTWRRRYMRDHTSLLVDWEAEQEKISNQNAMLG